MTADAPTPRVRSQIIVFGALLALLASSVVASMATAPPADAHLARAPAISPPGALVLIGGSLAQNRPIIREIIKLAGGRGVARIGVITTGSVPPQSADEATGSDLANSVTDGRYYARLFERFGAASTYRVPLDISATGEWPGDNYGAGRVDDAAVVDRVGRMTGFFFGGGSQARYVDVMQNCPSTTCTDRPVLGKIRDRLAAGAVVAGSSAGNTIMQGSPVVLSGESWLAWANGVQDDDELFTPGAVVRDEGGFGFFDAGVLDSHVGERGRQGRLVRIAMYGDDEYAFGVDGATALIVRRAQTDTERMSVLGDGGVHVLDLSQATFVPRQIRGVRWSWLRSGDGYNPQTHRVVQRDAREAVTRAHPDLSVGDIWSVRAAAAGRMTKLGVDLVRSRKSSARGVTFQKSPRFEVLLIDDDVTRAWQSRKGDPRRAFTDVRLRIERQ